MTSTSNPSTFNIEGEREGGRERGEGEKSIHGREIEIV
jgi:hypothetical protein